MKNKVFIIFNYLSNWMHAGCNTRILGCNKIKFEKAYFFRLRPYAVCFCNVGEIGTYYEWLWFRMVLFKNVKDKYSRTLELPDK